jgi:hypothetical protein
MVRPLLGAYAELTMSLALSVQWFVLEILMLVVLAKPLLPLLWLSICKDEVGELWFCRAVMGAA